MKKIDIKINEAIDNNISVSLQNLNFINDLAVIGITRNLMVSIEDGSKRYIPVNDSFIYRGLIDKNKNIIIPVSNNISRIDIIDRNNIILTEEMMHDKFLQLRTLHYTYINESLKVVKEWKNAEYIRTDDNEITIVELVKSSFEYKNDFERYNPVKKMLLFK